MKLIIVLIAILAVAGVSCLIGSRLSSDALGMALGMMLGTLSGIPVALIVLAAGHHRQYESADRNMQPPQLFVYPPPPASPHVLPQNNSAIVDVVWRECNRDQYR